MMIIDIPQSIPDRFHPSLANHQIQQANMATQYRNILEQIDRRLRSALAKGDRPLYNQLEAERQTIQARLP
jgi:hypothetical protein